MAIISCQNISVYYDSIQAVDNVSFDIQKGDYVCIIGENGSGKSTLIKTLLGLITPKTGSIVLGDGLTKNHIGYLPQQTVVQRDFPASVYEVVLSGCLNQRGLRPFYSYKEKNIASMNLERLGILELKNKSYRELSGGQQQRVLLARALCAAEDVLLLDEPVTGLDPLATNEMYSILKTLNSKNGVTIIMVSHDISSALSQADKILYIQKELLFYGTTQDYINSNISHKMIGDQNNA